MTKRETITVEVEQGAISFPAIYERDRWDRYGCAFVPSGDALEHLPLIDGRYGVRCTSLYRPEVLIENSRVRWLVEELQNRDARNVRRCSIFCDVRTELHVRPYEWSFREFSNTRSGTGLYLEKIRIFPW